MHDKAKVTIDLAEYNELLSKKSFEDVVLEAVKSSTTPGQLAANLSNKETKFEYAGHTSTIRMHLYEDGRPLVPDTSIGRSSKF